jgi:NADH:ubiquinone reductase (non-electrogenic)
MLFLRAQAPLARCIPLPRALSTSPLQPPPRRFSTARNTAVVLATLWGSLFLADTIVNDDLDVVFTNRFRRPVPVSERDSRPHVVVLGAGWGALSMLRKLHLDEYRVTIISPKNYFLFTPLLPSTTVGTLHQRSIVEPIRQFCNRSGAEEAKFIEAECMGIDLKNNRVQCVDNSAVVGAVSEFHVPYDHLIVAVGCESATFGIPGVKEHALFMKEISHSYLIRDRILDSLETANIPGQPEDEIRRLLHFVVVGGGPSGVEFAAELHDFIADDVAANYPEHAGKVRVTLVEALSHVLTTFDDKLIGETEKAMEHLHIGLELNSAVQQVDSKSLRVKKKDGTVKEMPYGVLVWVAGNATRQLVKDTMLAIGPESQKDRRGLVVDKHLRVKGTANVWALGDCAISGWPPTAQVAFQQGSFLGRMFNDLAEDMHRAQPSQGVLPVHELHQRIDAHAEFNYLHKGMFAYIGEHKAVAQLPVGDAWGYTTFFLWRGVYFSKLLSYKNRFMVGTDWMKAFFFGRDVSRA